MTRVWQWKVEVPRSHCSRTTTLVTSSIGFGENQPQCCNDFPRENAVKSSRPLPRVARTGVPQLDAPRPPALEATPPSGPTTPDHPWGTIRQARVRSVAGQSEGLLVAVEDALGVHQLGSFSFFCAAARRTFHLRTVRPDGAVDFAERHDAETASSSARHAASLARTAVPKVWACAAQCGVASQTSGQAGRMQSRWSGGAFANTVPNANAL